MHTWLAQLLRNLIFWRRQFLPAMNASNVIPLSSAEVGQSFEVSQTAIVDDQDSTAIFIRLNRGDVLNVLTREDRIAHTRQITKVKRSDGTTISLHWVDANFVTVRPTANPIS